MTSLDRTHPPTTDEIDRLKRLVDGIVRRQGNRFVRELMRSVGVPIGRNKADFAANLLAAIEDGRLRLADVERWAETVEGWGDQHVYLYEVTPGLRRRFARAAFLRAAEAAGFGAVVDAGTVDRFPQDPELTSIRHDGTRLTVVWQETSQAWMRDDDRDFDRSEDHEQVNYRAYRLVEDRATIRFEAHLDRGLAGLFVPHPVEDEEHRIAVDEAMRVIDALFTARALEAGRIDIAALARTLDQSTLRRTDGVVPHRARLGTDGGYLEFASTSPTRSYLADDTLAAIRRTIGTREIKSFTADSGSFLFEPGDVVDRRLRVTLYGGDDRIRLWSQMTADEVWAVLSRLAAAR